MGQTPVRCKRLLTTDQCITAIKVIENQMLESTPGSLSAVWLLVNIADVWKSEQPESADDCHFVKVCWDKVYIDRSGGETIVYCRTSGTYCIGYPTRPADSWAVL